MSIISIGKLIYNILREDEAVSAMTTTIVPVFSPNAELRLPYITYSRTELGQRPAKTGSGACSAKIAVDCYAATYEQSLDIAEAVVRALDNVRASDNGMVMRGCSLSDASEGFEGDAYMQSLVFEVRA